ncbi:MAG TPA: hypothetical protein VNM22_20105 [Candidatus Limnocylindrales bacterium]|nr:hypothetical protein [Candidatus Limnocylindrales bacterium]
MTCKEVTRLISESLDKKLPFYQRLSLHAHFRLCIFCKRYARQLLFIRETLRSLSQRIEDPVFPLPSLSEEARETMKRRIREQVLHSDQGTEPSRET